MAKKKATKKSTGARNGVAKKNAKTPEPSDKVVATTIPLHHKVPDGQRPVFANNFAIQHEEATAFLLFFEARVPLALTDPKPKVESIDAECVSQVVVPITLVPQIITAMQENLQRHQDKAKATLQFIDFQNQAKGKAEDA